MKPIADSRAFWYDCDGHRFCIIQSVDKQWPLYRHDHGTLRLVEVMPSFGRALDWLDRQDNQK